MSYLPISLPPGVYRNGTEHEAAGRYYDANLIRWQDKTIKPVGGWRLRTDTTVSGAARAILTWRDNSANTWLGIGTHSKVYAVNRGNTIYDVTPSGFTAGAVDSSASGGFGAGSFGAGTFGTPRPDNSLVVDATVQTLDTWGEYLVGVSPDDNTLYEWQLGTSTAAAAITNAPSCDAVVVTAERFIFALGAGGDPRKVQWCDRENNTVWTPSATNEAGSFPLQTSGRLMCGKGIQGGTLLFTDVDLHLAQPTFDTLVYGFERVGTACGAISRQCVAALDSKAVWMGKQGFWIYNGYVQPLRSDVHDYVYSNLNTLQAAKVYAVRNSAFSEVWWFYPSGASIEVDSYVVWNYRENWWNIGSLDRTCGTDRGVFAYPIMIDASGKIYDHEVGLNYDSQSIFAETGPIEIGNGDAVAYVRQILPDQSTLGGVSMTLKGKLFPNGEETAFGPYTLADPTSARAYGRQIKVRYDGANPPTDFRIGTPRLEIGQGGNR